MVMTKSFKWPKVYAVISFKYKWNSFLGQCQHSVLRSSPPMELSVCCFMLTERNINAHKKQWLEHRKQQLFVLSIEKWVMGGGVMTFSSCSLCPVKYSHQLVLCSKFSIVLFHSLVSSTTSHEVALFVPIKVSIQCCLTVIKSPLLQISVQMSR